MRWRVEAFVVYNSIGKIDFFQKYGSARTIFGDTDACVLSAYPNFDHLLASLSGLFIISAEVSNASAFSAPVTVGPL